MASLESESFWRTKTWPWMM
ncbi:hypothetical protein R3I93_006478 [Phoxinus phoxinus]|uniref:Uncharacterized protein n=1 Tax=Phoxinus phoxinus TaxID=58324 RepID=A0AAN9DC07_9TELE